MAIFNNEYGMKQPWPVMKVEKCLSIYLGEIDVLLLDNNNSPFPSYDLSRNIHLNASNETVQSVICYHRHKD